MRKTIITITLLTAFTLYLLAGASKTNGETKNSLYQDNLKASISRGKQVYTQHCMPCHQADGSGVPNLNPPLIKTKYVSGDKKRLIDIVLKGMNEEIEIDGDYYANPMPPLTALKDREIADVLTFVRNSFGNKYQAVTEAEIKKARVALSKSKQP